MKEFKKVKYNTMKLWKTKKPISCMASKSAALQNDDTNNSNGIQMAPMLSGEFYIDCFVQ